MSFPSHESQLYYAKLKHYFQINNLLIFYLYLSSTSGYIVENRNIVKMGFINDLRSKWYKNDKMETRLDLIYPANFCFDIRLIF